MNPEDQIDDDRKRIVDWLVSNSLQQMAASYRAIDRMLNADAAQAQIAELERLYRLPS